MRVTGVRGGGGGGESSSLVSALLVGTVIWRWSVEGRWREAVDQEVAEGAEAAPVLKVLTLDMTDGCLDSWLSLPPSLGASLALAFANCLRLRVSKLLNILSFSSKACASLASSS